jgi:phosphoribosylformylglycinamidine synthase
LTSFPKILNPVENLYTVTDLQSENQIRSLGFDKQDIEYYDELFRKLGRRPTNNELHDLSQSNSEHSRHWFFKGKLVDPDGKPIEKSLFQMIKDTQKFTNDRSIVAFCDNASAIKGYVIKRLKPVDKIYVEIDGYMHITFTAETHNFPTGIEPFNGAATGVGGRIRDTHAIGRGAYVVAGIAGYCVGNLYDSKFVQKNVRTLLRASDGASDYGNKFGEPLILGFCRDYGLTDPNGTRIEWIKPIMFSGGTGMLLHNDVTKNKPTKDMYVVKIGGPCYRIGIGGGAASSRDQDTKNINEDLSAVQRGDPEMENKLNRLIRSCIELSKNPIQSIHDQGAGGTANVTKEIVYPAGAEIDLDKMQMGDRSLNSLEKWISEYQEQDTILVNKSDIDVVKNIGIRENVGVNVIGEVTNSKKIHVKSRGNTIVELPLEDVVGDTMKMKRYELVKVDKKLVGLNLPKNDVVGHLRKVFRLTSVGSKRFLTNKVDRSVTGLVAQQQCVGPVHTPLSNFGVTAMSHLSLTGSVVAVGERPTLGQIDTACMARMAVSEMLTNMMFAKITNIKDIRCSGNWMWPLNINGEKWELFNACVAMCNLMNQLGIALDGGKDSLSMIYKDGNEVIVGPRQLVISGYAPMDDITIKVTPDFKRTDSAIIYVDLADRRRRLGGSALAQAYGQIGNESPDLVNPDILKDVFEKIQRLVENQVILAGHDISDGGFITALSEMAFAGNIGFNVTIAMIHEEMNSLEQTLFHEELGLILEVQVEHIYDVCSYIGDSFCHHIGRTDSNGMLVIRHGEIMILESDLTDLRDDWEDTSFNMEVLQAVPMCVGQERASLKTLRHYSYMWNGPTEVETVRFTYRPMIAMIREEGSNGDREMAAAFYTVGFTVVDVCMNDFVINPDLNLNSFRGVVFVGGFSYSDVFGAAKGWYATINSNQRIKDEFDRFKQRPDTFSLGVCNGCQLISLLGWIPGYKMTRNQSGRFESRFSTVIINDSNSIMLKGMNGAVLGSWVAHGEGQFVLESSATLSTSLNRVIQYVDPDNLPTTLYPFNPNGSPDGIAAVCSRDGRHLAMMPHPERSFLKWQWPVPQHAADNVVPTVSEKYTPWIIMFKNAYDWTINN